MVRFDTVVRMREEVGRVIEIEYVLTVILFCLILFRSIHRKEKASWDRHLFVDQCV